MMAVDFSLVEQFRSEVADRLATIAQEAGETRLQQEDAEELARVFIQEALERHAEAQVKLGAAFLSSAEEEEYAEATLAGLFGLGRLQPLVNDETIENININGYDQVWVKRVSDRAHPTEQRRERSSHRIADSDSELIELIRHAASNLGSMERAFNQAQPQLDMQLPGGHRLSAVIEVSRRPTISIRRHTLIDEDRARLSELQRLGMIDERLMVFLRAAVLARRSMIIAGGTNAGKTTLLRALANEIPASERLITIEKARELGLEDFPTLHPDCVALETREPNTEGEGGIDMRQLVRRGLRMDGDRVIVGEVLGDEVIDMLNAMSQGNDGSMCTIHANSADGVFRRIATYAIQAPERLDFAATSSLIGGAIEYIVFIKHGYVRTNTGESLRRVVDTVLEVGEDGTVGGSTPIFGAPSSASDELQLAVPLAEPSALGALQRHGCSADVFQTRRRS